MNRLSFNILRIGIGITFLWIGILIFLSPEVWGSYIAPWVVELLPISVKNVMILTAILDVTIGLLLLTKILVWRAAVAGAVHLGMVLIVSGINEGTVRDIAIIAGAIALAVDSYKGQSLSL